MVWLAASTITTRAAAIAPAVPLQRSGSWPVGYSVPAMVYSGASPPPPLSSLPPPPGPLLPPPLSSPPPPPPVWQLKQDRPGFISGEPVFPCVQNVLLVQIALAFSGSGGGGTTVVPQVPP